MNPQINCKSLVLFISLAYAFSGCANKTDEPQRFGQVDIIDQAEIEHFKGLQKTIYPEVIEELNKAHIQNYCLYLKDLDDTNVSVFTYFEYTGDDFNSEMEELRKNPAIKKWKSSVEQTSAEDVLPCSENSPRYRMEEVFYFNGLPVNRDTVKIQQYGMVIGLRPEYIDSYTLLHKYAWPEVLDAIARGNIRNYSIYLHELEKNYYLFSYFEYVGNNFSDDMAMIDTDPASIAWMKFTDQVCQIPIATRAEGEWWAVMEEISAQKINSNYK
jgi:L-rhamnose mutarotase